MYSFLNGFVISLFAWLAGYQLALIMGDVNDRSMVKTRDLVWFCCFLGAYGVSMVFPFLWDWLA